VFVPCLGDLHWLFSFLFMPNTKPSGPSLSVYAHIWTLLPFFCMFVPVSSPRRGRREEKEEGRAERLPPWPLMPLPIPVATPTFTFSPYLPSTHTTTCSLPILLLSFFCLSWQRVPPQQTSQKRMHHHHHYKHVQHTSSNILPPSLPF